MQRMTWLAAGRPCAVLMLPLFAVACGSESVNQAPSTPGVVRLATEDLAQARLRPPDSLTIPLDDRWHCLSGPNPGFEGGAMVLPAGERKHLLQVDLEVEAQCYSEFRVSMKLGAGERALLSWESDLEAVAAANPGIEIPITADGAYHSYVFPLRTGHAETWAGSITRLVLTPSDAPAHVEIRSVELAWAPPDAPARVTINNCTHEALLGTQAPWRVTVPHRAMFQVDLGMLERSWRQCGSDGVRFRVALDAPRSRRRVLVDEVLEPSATVDHRSWRLVQAKLDAYAGRDVTLWLSVDNLDTTAGDYAYWGNPLVFSCTRDDAATPVILVSCDTLRADHMTCYGYDRDTTPRLDAWTTETVVFDNAIAQETWTPTSHMTMLTGLYPKHHGVSPNANLAEAATTLPEALAAQGYVTAGYTGHSWWLLPWRGFAHGFDVYNTPASFRDVFETNALALAWLARHAPPRAFLFIHNYDLHSKAEDGPYSRTYDPGDPRHYTFSTGLAPPRRIEHPEPGQPGFTLFLQAHNQSQLAITEAERRYLVACYDDCVRYVDQAVFDFLQALKDQDLYDPALIIVTSDHGEEFGEHGRYLHTQVYEECCRVPLMIKFPHGRFAGRRVSDVVQLADLYATILDVAGCPAASATDGHSLLGLLEEGDKAHGVAFSQRHAFQALRTRTGKLIRNVRTGDYELYDLAADPPERNNVVSTQGQVFEVLRGPLERFFKPPSEGWHLVFSNDGTVWQGTIALTTEDRIESVRLVRKDRIESEDLETDAHTVTGVIHLTPAIQREELLVKTVSPEARLYVSLEGEAPFTLHRGEETRDAADQFRVVLDPADPAYPRTPPQQEPHEPVPALSFWFGETSAHRTPAKDLPEQAIEELTALGYM